MQLNSICFGKILFLEHNNSGVNGTSVDNRRTLPGSRVYGEMEVQGPGSRHQAIDHN